MRSIIQEASSITKAFEQAWDKASKPKEFSVTILEFPEKNFFGITTHSAKIALYFGAKAEKKEQAPKQHKEKPKQHQEQPSKEAKQKSEPKPEPKSEQKPEPKSEQKPEPKSEQKSEPKPEQKSQSPRKKQESLWKEEHTTYARTWLTEAFKLMGHTDVTFEIEPKHLFMKATLSKKMLSDPQKEKHLLASLSTLLMSSLQRNFHQGFPGHKVVITHSQ
jgi:outer membrane biosynthesis protein TonB